MNNSSTLHNPALRPALPVSTEAWAYASRGARWVGWVEGAHCSSSCWWKGEPGPPNILLMAIQPLGFSLWASRPHMDNWRFRRRTALSPNGLEYGSNYNYEREKKKYPRALLSQVLGTTGERPAANTTWQNHSTMTPETKRKAVTCLKSPCILILFPTDPTLANNIEVKHSFHINRPSYSVLALKHLTAFFKCCA